MAIVLKIVTVFKTTTNAGSNGVDIFEHRGIFDAYHVATCLGLDIVARQEVGKGFGFLVVRTTNGEIGETFQGHFLRVRRTTNAGQLVIGYVIYLMEIFGANQILVGNDTLDGCHDILVTDACPQFLQVIFQIG